MELESTLDVDLVALERDDEVAVLLDITALAEKVVLAATLVIRPADDLSGFTLWNDLPACGVEDGVMVELGDFYAGDTRRILLGLEIPGRGAATICELELRWVDLASMTEKVATIPVKARQSPAARWLS